MPQLTIEQAIRVGLQHHKAGQLAQAEQIYRQILAHDPNDFNALQLLGMMAYQLGNNDASIELVGKALTIQPNSAEGHNTLGSALATKKDFGHAIAAFRRAIALKPSYAEAHGNLGNVLKDVGQIDEAISEYRQALALNPTLYRTHDSLLYTLHCSSKVIPSDIAAEHRVWNIQHAEPLRRFIVPHENPRDPDRRLRIGYVSSDLRDHPVGRFLSALFAHHDHRQFEVFAYLDLGTQDGITGQLKSHADGWRQITGMPDQEAAEMIRADGIDILVDLSGHTAGNRLLLFARKPAPVQVTYLGYPNTTGLPVIDYRLTDVWADPPGQQDALNSESLYRLPATAWCFPEPAEAPEPAPAPLLKTHHVTFGSFNSLLKMNEPLLAIWARILQATPDSRLLLKASGLEAPEASTRVRGIFLAHGIDADRLILKDRTTDFTSHLSLYGEMDIALDTFPYHGTTTTCEALWMGVPVVSLASDSHVSRVGVSLLNNIGSPELIAATPDEYIGIAIALANDRDRLLAMRSGLRERMRNSRLMDAPAFASDVESAYRQMWRAWCGRAG